MNAIDTRLNTALTQIQWILADFIHSFPKEFTEILLIIRMQIS